MFRQKGVVVALCALALGGAILVVVTTLAQRGPRSATPERLVELEQKERSGRLHFRERAELAKARGQRQVTVPALITNYSLDMPAGPEAADRVLSDYSVVIVQLVEKQSYLADEAVVRTWNKFRIVETLLQVPPRPSPFTERESPQELLPVREDELLVHSEGGAVTIDGVEVIQNDSSVPPFQPGARYVLVLSVNPSTRVGEMALGLYGFLPINPDHTLDAGRDHHYLQQVIKKRHGGSLRQLRDALRARTGS